MSLDADDLMTVSAVASVLRVSKMTVYRMVEQRELPSIHIRRSIKIRRGDLQAYILANTVGETEAQMAIPTTHCGVRGIDHQPHSMTTVPSWRGDSKFWCTGGEK